MADIWAKLPDDFMREWLKKRYMEKMRQPFGWMIVAYRLKRAADHLFSIAETARDSLREAAIVESSDGRKQLSLSGMILADDVVNNLESDMEQLYTYFLLSGLALENIVKGILVAKDPTLIGDDGKLKRKTHNLAKCVEQCGFVLTIREKEVLNALEKYVVWAGRYPGPTEAYLPKRTADGNIEQMPDIGFRDYDLIEILFARAYDSLAHMMEAKRIESQE